MWEWIKKHLPFLTTLLVTIGVLLFVFACEPKVQSLYRDNAKVNRQELQLELDQFITLAQLRMADLEKQEQLRAVIVQNALLLVQGQPFNPVGLITGIASIYGIATGASNIGKGVKKKYTITKVKNGTT